MPHRVLVQRWHDFYIVGGTAAATLVGLLFVGLSLHLRAVLARTEVRSLARVTLANFGLLLFVSLFMVVPHGASSAAPPLLISGLFTLAITAPSLIAAGRSRTRTMRPFKLVLRFGLSVLGYVGVVIAGAMLARDSFDAAFAWLVGVFVLLLVVSLRNSWDLLVSVGAATLEAPASEPGRGAKRERWTLTPHGSATRSDRRRVGRGGDGTWTCGRRSGRRETR